MYHSATSFSAPRSTNVPSHRAIVFVCPEGALGERQADAIETAFPWTTVTSVAAVDALFESFCDIVALIVVHPTFLDEVSLRSREIGDRHPLALITVLDAGKDALPGSILASRFIRGVLPLGGKNDLWLSVVGLMLRGGEYFPRHCAGARPGRARRPAPRRGNQGAHH